MSPIMVEGPNSPQESIETQIIESVLGSLELEGFDLAIVPLEAGGDGTSGDRSLDQRTMRRSRQTRRRERCLMWQMRGSKTHNSSSHPGVT